MNLLPRVILAIVALVFFSLSFFVWPSSDDFGFAYNYQAQALVTCARETDAGRMTIDFPCHRYYSFDNPLRPASLLDLAANEYLTFVGRYFTNILAFYFQGELARHLGPWNLYRAYPLFPVLTIISFLLSAGYFARQWGYRGGLIPRQALFWGPLGFVVLYLQHMPHLASSFFQVSQLLMHQICIPLSLLWLASLRACHDRPKGWPRMGTALLAAVLIVAIMGASEIILFWNGFLAFAIMTLATWNRLAERRFYQMIFVLALGGGLAVVLAPGTLSRIGETSGAAISLMNALGLSLSWSLRYLASWILSPTLWALTLLALPGAIQVVASQSWYRRVTRIHWLAFIVLWVGMIWASWLLLAGIGRDMPLRVVNGIYFYFLLGWFVGLHLTIAAFNIRALPWKHCVSGSWNKIPILLLGLSFLIPAGFLRPTNNFLLAIHDLSGPLWNYRQQQSHRLRQIAAAVDAGETEITITPFREKPESVFYEDILPERSNNWRNRFMGAFYGLKTVHLEPAGPARRSPPREAPGRAL
ncbi:MAG: hypothetical protein HQL76_15510 [Magnetococcales bacterium]|nr:hypothetical protein [Magnetococcales bacterium]